MKIIKLVEPQKDKPNEASVIDQLESQFIAEPDTWVTNQSTGSVNFDRVNYQ